ncbi:hypothetical protein EJ110_NYTH26944 [Nymphaea thermarum]|nr:hypothetical protein EJ110_NYTH26944 [Nymphaea thermarum]
MARNVFFKIFTVTNDLALLTSLSIVMGLATIIPFKQKSVSRHFPKIYWSMYSAVVFTILAYLSSRLVVFQSRSGYTKWLMLPLFIVAPMVCVLFFWRMWRGPVLDHRDVGTEITKTTSITGADQIPKAKRNDMMKIGWKSSSGASHWIGDASRREDKTGANGLALPNNQVSISEAMSDELKPPKVGIAQKQPKPESKDKAQMWAWCRSLGLPLRP